MPNPDVFSQYLQVPCRAQERQQSQLERSRSVPYGNAQDVPRIRQLQPTFPELYQPEH